MGEEKKRFENGGRAEGPEAGAPAGDTARSRSLRPVLPENPVEAATHPEPYPYYAALVARRALVWDESLRAWVAASAEAVTAVLTHPACRVRPVAEPVPRALLGSPAGEIFRHLVRMVDEPAESAGSGRCPFQKAVSVALDGVDPARLGAEAERWAGRLVGELRPDLHPDRCADFAFALPVYTLGSLLGLGEEELREVAVQGGELVRCIFPGGTPEQVERGKGAARSLLETFRYRLAEQEGKGEATLLSGLARQARDFGRSDREGIDAVVANAIGFLTQSYDATAALIASTLLALARRPDLTPGAGPVPEDLPAIVNEVVRFESPVQNTRRFLAESAVIEGVAMREGDAVLVLLAAANRDPLANPEPDRFDPARPDPKVFTFGVGAHACPGQSIATTIARSGVARLLRNGLDPRTLETEPAFRPSANVRMPLFARRIG